MDAAAVKLDFVDDQGADGSATVRGRSSDSGDWAYYFTPSRSQRGLGLTCRGLGHRTGRIPPIVDRVLPYSAALFVTAGAGWVAPGQREGGDLLSVAAPAVLFLPGGVPHSYAPGPDGWQEDWVLFEGPAVAAYEELGYLSRRHPVQAAGDPLRLSQLFSALLEVARSGRPAADAEMVGPLHQLVVALGSRPTIQTKAAVLARLRQLAPGPLPIAGYPQETGLSRYELQRIVHAEAGCSLKEYVSRARIDAAQLFLANSEIPVSQVAHRSGFADPAYFSRAFSKRVGMSPRAFRRAFATPRRDPGGALTSGPPTASRR